MSYHDLSECTLSPDERVQEANKIINMIEGSDFTENELSMISQITDTQRCSVKQLFWLRDIKDKYL